jgi:hypothetical protein
MIRVLCAVWAFDAAFLALRIHEHAGCVNVAVAALQLLAVSASLAVVRRAQKV